MPDEFSPAHNIWDREFGLALLRWGESMPEQKLFRPIKLSGRALYDDGQMINSNVINHVTKERLGWIRFQQTWLLQDRQMRYDLFDVLWRCNPKQRTCSYVHSPLLFLSKMLIVLVSYYLKSTCTTTNTMLWVSELTVARWPPCADVLDSAVRHLVFIYIYV